MPFYNANEIWPQKDYETKKQPNKQSKNENFTAKTEYLTLKAHSNNVQLQSYKNLTTQA